MAEQGDKANDERAKQAERARKLLAQRKKKKAAGGSPSIGTPSSPAVSAVSALSGLGDATAAPSARTSLSLDDSVRAELEEKPKAEAVEAVDPRVAGDVPEVKVEVEEGQDPPEPKTNGEKPAVGPAEELKKETPKQQVEDAKPAGKKNKTKGKEGSDQDTEAATKDEPPESDAAAKPSDSAEPAPAYPKTPVKVPATSNAVSPSPSHPPLSSTDSTAQANLQQTVSLLIAERGDLQSQLAEVKAQLVAAKRDSQLLEEGRALLAQLEVEKKDLEERVGNAEAEAGKVAGLEDEAKRVKEKLEVAQKECEGLREEKERTETELRGKAESEAERVGELEKALERSRSREGGLEAEIGRLRQTNNELSSSLEKLTADLEALRSSSLITESTLADLKSAHEALQSSHSTLTAEHSTLQSTHSTLSSSHADLQAQHAESSSSLKSLDTAHSAAKAELELTKTKLAAAGKRAEVAEKRQAALQSENEELLKQLEEVRVKVVQAMEDKAGMAEQVGSWETKGNGWEKTRAELEAQIEEFKDLHEQVSSLAEDNRAKADRISELESQHESSAAEHGTIVASLRTELEAAKAASIPLPTSPLVPTTTTTPTDHPDTISSLEANHALEISSLTLQVRTLESSLHTSTTRIHSLQKTLTDLHAAYATSQRERDHALAAIAAGSSPVPVGRAGKGGYFLSPADEPTSPYGALGRGDPQSPGTPSRTGTGRRLNAVDAILPASVRHKRQVSLTALKARMEPSFEKPLGSPGRMGSVVEEDEGASAVAREGGEKKGLGEAFGPVNGNGSGEARMRVRKQFGDEIMFCCPACDGDLITL